MSDPSNSRAPGTAGSGGQQNPILRFLRERWLAIILGIVVIVFIAQNTTRVSINILWLHIHSPLWFILAVTAVVGIVIGLVIARRRAVARRHRQEPLTGPAPSQ